MRFTVTWTPHALEQLAELWFEAVDQQKCTDAAKEWIGPCVKIRSMSGTKL
jgi:hypothetical protein